MKKNNILEARRARVDENTRASVDFSFEIVDRIHQILESKGMSQKDLADLLGKKESEISRWMRGTHNFTISTIMKIEHVLGCKILHVQKDVKVSSINATPFLVSLQCNGGTLMSGMSKPAKYRNLSSRPLNEAIKLN